MKVTCQALVLVALLLAPWPHAPDRCSAATYDPLALPATQPESPQDLSFVDNRRQREIPLRVYFPPRDAAAPAPVVLFSHGLGGSREGCAYLGRHWSARGYAVVFVQHPGSDKSVLEGLSDSERRAALRDAANIRSFIERCDDIRAVLDQLTTWNAAAGEPLSGQLDLAHVGMSGHSFGARTTQAIAGQQFPRADMSFVDTRVKAAIPMSPSTPGRRTDPRDAFGQVRIPWLLMTGTDDLVSIGGADMESRLGVYPALPPGSKYELVLYRAEHSAFVDRALAGDKLPRNPQHHRAILALSTAFWDAYLHGDTAARDWLDGQGPRTVLDEHDRWQHK